MKPMISYYGGKQRLASKIIPYIPKHTVYVEPFCGGATLLFKKPYPNTGNFDHYKEVINDKDERLINMYRILQTRYDEFIHLLNNTLYSEAEHRKAKNILNGNIDADVLWQAWAYFVKISQSFSHVLHGGWKRTVDMPNPAHTWKKRIERLYLYKERMASVHISCQEALVVIKQWDSPQTFFYCDPPYPGAHQGHYEGYTLDNFKELVYTLKHIQGSMILSCTHQKVKIPKTWKRIKFPVYVSAAKSNPIKKEEYILIKQSSGNYKPNIEKSLNSGKHDCFTGDKIWQS